MKLCIVDIETDGLDPTVIHCVCSRVVDTKDWSLVLDQEQHDIPIELTPKIYFLPEADKYVFHNGLNFDVPVLRKAGFKIDYEDVIDTMVVSRLVDYSFFRTHSLQEIGDFLGCPKLEYKGGWEKRTDEMVEYCWGDVNTTEAALKFFWKDITDKSLAKAMRVEHDMAIICNDMSENGFTFDDETATELLMEIEDKLAKIEAEFQHDFPPKRTVAKTIKYRTKTDGSLYANVAKALEAYPDHEITTDILTGDKVLVCYTKVPFKPSSPKDRIDALWEAGWKPFEKTKGHREYTRR